MARNYTDDELQAIAKLVRTTVRRQYGALGNRRTDVTFSDIQDAAIGVFVLKANAPYYVVRLGVQREDELTAEAQTTLNDLVDTTRATDRRVLPVESISSLANARSALRALSSATDERSTSLTRIEDVPAYQRFDQSTARFLRDEGSKSKSSGDIVQTPEEARERVADLVTELEEEYTEVLRRAGLLRDAVADFDQLSLPAKFSAAVISNSLTVIDDRYDELNALTPEARLSVLRDVVLDVLATRSTVKGFGALTPTQTFVYFDGEGGPYADLGYPAIAAFVQSDIPGPWVILPDPDIPALDLVIDGTHSFTVELPESFVAQVDGLIAENYDIFDVDNPPSELKNDLLTLRVTNFFDLDITLTPGAGRTAQAISDDINAVVGARPVIAEPFNRQIRFTGSTYLTAISGPNATFTQAVEPPATDDWGDLPSLPELGDYLYIESSLPANTGWYIITDDSGLPASFEAGRVAGGTVVTQNLPSNAPTMELGVGGRGVRIRFTDAHAATSVANGERIGLVTDTEVKEWAHNTLGFIQNVSVQSLRSTAAFTRDFINNNPIIVPTGEFIGVVQATIVFEATHYTGAIRTEATDSTKVVVVKLEAQADVTAGVSATFTVADTTGVVSGDYIAIRVATANKVTNWGEVTSVTPTTIVATLNEAAVAEADITVEVGPDFSGIALPSQIIIANDPLDPNDAEYDVQFIGGVDETGPPFELGLSRALIQHTQLGYQSYSLQAEIGQYHLRLTSQSTLLDTKVEVEASSTGGSIFWGSLPQEDVGDTEWFSIPEEPKRLDDGDLLELHDTSAQAPTQVITILKSVTAPNLLQLEVTLQTDVGPWNMAQSSPAPYGRVRKLRKDNYELFKTGLENWFEQPESDITVYFRELRRLLNPLIVNKNPKAADVNAAVSHLFELQTHLTDLRTYLAVYEAPRVEEVDRLLETYQQHGSTRANDLLVEGSFSTFFNLTQAEASYSGNVQQAIREVNINDLPQRKTGRNPGGEVIDQYEEPDFEYDFSDTDGEEDLPVPGNVSEYIESAF
jgi:hypothetical protein